MKRFLLCLPVAVAMIVVGCDEKSTPGGPGASNPDNKKPVVGQGDDTFSLSPPTLSTSIKQGETKSATIDIKRGKNFDQDVAVTFGDLPKGVTIEPASPKIKHGDSDLKVTIKAADDAALGDHAVKLTGKPAKGGDAAAELKITVNKK